MNFHFWNPESAGWPSFGGRHWRGGHRGRMKRGLIRLLLLKMLLEGARHGYDFMRELRRRGWAQGSPGSIYPTLQWLEEQGFVESREENGKRVYVITPEGEAHLREHGERFFEDFVQSEDEDAADPAHALREEGKKFFAAIAQAAHGSDEATIAKIIEIIKSARKEIYTLLANE